MTCFRGRGLAAWFGMFLAELSRLSYLGDGRDCLVVPVECVGCKKTFEELLGAAQARVKLRRLDFRCLNCDDDARDSSYVKVVDQKKGSR